MSAGRTPPWLGGAALAALAAVACSSGKPGVSGYQSGVTGTIRYPPPGGTGSSHSGAGGFDPQACTPGAPSSDQDLDGYSSADGDCNDCDPNVNPGAVEVVGAAGASPADENCDGRTDEAFVPCDSGHSIADHDAVHAARAIDICTKVADDHYGLASAHWVRADGSAVTPSYDVGILSGFGSHVAPRLGARMLGLSSGHARDASDPDACGSFSCGTTGPGWGPPGFPQDTPGCGGGHDISDDIGLEVELVAPTNARGYAFDFTFYTFEYPEWVCTTFNDQFIALVAPAPAGSINGNISFDSQSRPVSVNIAFFDVCAGCALGTSALAGTGFGLWNDAGATGWLRSEAPIDGGGSFALRFAIWDTGDTLLDSTVLIDHFRWIASGGTVAVGTGPVVD